MKQLSLVKGALTLSFLVLALGATQVAPKASGAAKWQSSPVDTSLGQLMGARANATAEQPLVAAFYSIKDGKTSARRIQQATLPARPPASSTPSPVFDLTTIDSQTGQGSLESATQSNGLQADQQLVTTGEPATRQDAADNTELVQQHLSLAAVADAEPAQNRTDETGEPGARPVALTTATGSPLSSSSTPSSLSMNLDGMMLSTRPRAAVPNAAGSRASSISGSTGPSSAPSTGRSKQSKASKSARIGETAKASRRVPFSGVPFSSPATKGQRIRPATPESNQMDESSSELPLAPNEQAVSASLAPMDARGLEIMNNLLNKPSWRELETQSQGLNEGVNPNEDLVMSVMSSADGKERRLVMISRDSLNSLQQLAKQQQLHQSVGQTSTVKSTAVGQQLQFTSNGPSAARWPQQQQVSSQVSRDSQTTTLAPSVSSQSSSSSSMLTSLSSVFTDQPTSSQPSTSGQQQSSSQAALEQQIATTTTPTTTTAATTAASSAGPMGPSADSAPATTIDSQLTQSRTSASLGQSGESKSTFREVPVAQDSSATTVPKRTSSSKLNGSKSAKGKGSHGSRKGKSKSQASKQSATSGHSNSTLSSTKSASTRRASGSKATGGAKRPQLLAGSGANQVRARAEDKSAPEQMTSSLSVPWSNGVDVQQSAVGRQAMSVEQPKAAISELDLLDGLRAAIPGEPQLDYLIHSVPPKTSFDCMAQSCPGGYYADLESQCQVFHICQNDGRFDTFLCPNGTIFSQQHFVCVWWWQADCQQSPSFYKLNDAIYCNANVPQLGSSSFRQQQSAPMRTSEPSTTSSPLLRLAGAESTTLAPSDGSGSIREQAVVSGAAASLTGAGTGLPIRVQETSATEANLSDFDSANQQQLELSRKA